MATEVVSLRLPQGTTQRLKLLAWERSLKEQREIRWTALVRAAIEQVLADPEGATGS